MLDTHRLHLLVELRRLGTISAVAETHNYSKASVSQQLGILEREAGAPLLIKVGRGLQLTPSGHVLADQAVEVLARLEAAEVAVARSRTEATGTVRLAVFQSAAHSLLPTALARLAERHPGLRVEVAECDPETGLVGVRSRDYDLILAEQYPGRTRAFLPELDRVPLAHDAILLARPPGSRAAPDPAARKQETGARRADSPDAGPSIPVSANDAALESCRELAWVLEPRGTASRSWAEQRCRAAGFEPDVRYEVADLTAHVRLIHAGLAVGLLPDLVWAGAAPSVATTELRGAPRREIFSCARRVTADSPAIRAVREALGAAAARMAL